MAERSAIRVAMIVLVGGAACGTSGEHPDGGPADGGSDRDGSVSDASISDGGGPDAMVPDAARCPIAGCPEATPSAGASLRDVWIAPGGAVWAVGDDGLLGRRSPGVDWCWCTASAATLEGIWGSADDDLWIVGQLGTIVRYDGTTFSPVDLGTGADLRGIWGTGPGDVWVVGTAGTARHYDGVGWSVADVASNHTLYTVWAASSTDVWIGGRVGVVVDGESGSEGEVFRWDPATGGWNRELVTGGARTAAAFYGLSGSGADNVWAVGVDFPDGAAAPFSTAMRFDGMHWDGVGLTEELIAERTFNDVAVAAPGAEHGAWIVFESDPGEEAGALRFDGATWTGADPEVTAHLNAVDVRGTAMWAVGTFGKVVRWTDGRWVRDR